MQGSERASVVEAPTRAAWIEHLRLRNFRNFADVEVELPEPGVAVVGPNGSGKTNLLEAIYYLETFRSFRGGNDPELVRFGEDVFRVEASLRSPGGDRELAAAYDRSRRRKQVELDRQEVSRLSEAIGTLGAVVFSLEDVEIVRGGPANRRRFLNILLSLVEPGYVEALQEYRSILSQRNEALKEGAEEALLEAWTEGLVEAGASLMAARASWVAERAEGFRVYHQRISGGPAASLAYEPSVERRSAGPGAPAAEEEGEGAEGPESWARSFRRALGESRERERRRGVTVVGPQRDELAFEGQVAGEEPRDLRTYGSGGQQRTAALALRLVEGDTLRDHLGREPIYLLDDVFAELDRERSEHLFQLLDEGRSGQAIVASPKASELELRGGTLEKWRIRAGEVEPS